MNFVRSIKAIHYSNGMLTLKEGEGLSFLGIIFGGMAISGAL
jgi:hypothetical protein